MKSLIVKRSVVLAGHKTSVSLEEAFWNSLKEIAASGEMSVSELLAAIDSGRRHANLSSAIRLFVLTFYRDRLFHLLVPNPPYTTSSWGRSATSGSRLFIKSRSGASVDQL
jgi:predicted DNA-binding ribbon-helix-helix protein